MSLVLMHQVLHFYSPSDAAVHAMFRKQTRQLAP